MNVLSPQKFKEVLNGIVDGSRIKPLAKELGIAKQTIRNIIKEMPLWSKYLPPKEE